MNSGPGAGDQRVAQLRGAGVGNVDPRRLARVAAAVLVLALVLLVVVLYAAGTRKNNQVTRLRHDGVPVVVTITGCEGELGGSGSNAAGFVCHGTYRMDGRRYVEPLPGDTRYDPGTTMRAVAVPGDPQLVAPAATVASERPSATVYVLPTVLLVALLALCGTLFWALRRRSKPVVAGTPGAEGDPHGGGEGTGAHDARRGDRVDARPDSPLTRP